MSSSEEDNISKSSILADDGKYSLLDPLSSDHNDFYFCFLITYKKF